MLQNKNKNDIILYLLKQDANNYYFHFEHLYKKNTSNVQIPGK